MLLYCYICFTERFNSNVVNMLRGYDPFWDHFEDPLSYLSEGVVLQLRKKSFEFQENNVLFLFHEWYWLRAAQKKKLTFLPFSVQYWPDLFCHVTLGSDSWSWFFLSQLSDLFLSSYPHITFALLFL